MVQCDTAIASGCRGENGDHLEPALGKTYTAIRAWRFAWRVTTGTIGTFRRPLRLHRLHAVAHGILNSYVLCCDRTHARPHLCSRPRQGDRRERQGQDDQDRQYGAQAVQNDWSFQELIYHGQSYLSVNTRVAERLQELEHHAFWLIRRCAAETIALAVTPPVPLQLLLEKRLDAHYQATLPSIRLAVNGSC